MTPPIDDGAPVVRTRHWGGIEALALLFFGLGVVSRSAGLVLCGAVGIVLAAYGSLDGSPPPVDDVRLRRAVSDAEARTGDEIGVTVTVTNAGDRFLPDLRIVDGVPEAYDVVDGSPRCGLALRPGESVDFEYAVSPARGAHTWGPAQVIVANASGSAERDARIDAEEPTTVRCAPIPVSTGDLPVRALTSRFEGRVGIDAGGDGVEFFATRQYRHGDPYRRVDWKRFARSGELGTIELRNERSAKVVLVVDARPRAYFAPAPDGGHAVDRGIAAAGSAFATLSAVGDRVGLAVFGREEAWLAPGAGAEHRARANALLADTDVLPVDSDANQLYGSFLDERQAELLERRVDRLHRRLPADAQVFCFSPCCDDFMPTVMRRLDAYGHPVTMISPDPTRTDTPGRYLARLARRLRLQILTRDELRVIDWGAAEPLDAAISRAESRWS